VILAVCIVLILLFLALTAYQKFFATQPRFDSDAALLDELRGATVPDDPLPASADWPQWRGPRRDGVAAGRLLTDWPAQGPPRLWQVDGGEGYSSCAVAGGRLFTMLRDGDQEIVLCLDAVTGEPKWRFPYHAPFVNGNGSGPRSTPTLDGDRLYTVGATGLFHCLDAATGKPRWEKAHDLLAEFAAPNIQWGVSFSPLVDGDLVFTNPGGPNGNALAAFDKISGQLRWKTGSDPAGYSSPIAVQTGDLRQVLFFTGDSLVGVTAADGKPLWRFPWDTQFKVNAATPIAFRAEVGGRTADYVFITSGYAKGCALLKLLPDGKGGCAARAVYTSNHLCGHFASPVRSGPYVYGFNESELTCMDLRTGDVKWTKPREFNKGSLLRVNDSLLVLGENGKLALVEATPEEYREKASFRPFRQKSWTMPVLAGGRVYLRDEDKIACYDVEAR
jgi:outer membrane protein assembly factor BamB